MVTLYSCGITPYDSAHLGHAQVYLTFDILQRRLRDLGHETRCVRNVTDVDDDILRKARELGVHYLDLAAEEIARFDADMAALGLIPAWSEPRATSAIAEILTLIGSVLDSGHAYRPVRPSTSTSPPSPSLRVGQPRRPGRHAGHGGRARWASRRPRQAAPPRLRALAALPARRALLGVPLGPRAPRLAHRVLGPGPARAGGDHRRARWRTRPGLPPPRVRDGPVGIGDGTTVRPALAARRSGRPGRDEDVEVPRQPGLRRGSPEGVGAGRRSGWRCSTTTIDTTGSGRTRTCPARPGRLARWRAAPRSDGSDAGSGLQRVRAHLDDDLDTPGAMAALDDEADAGRPVDEGAGLLGVTL